MRTVAQFDKKLWIVSVIRINIGTGEVMFWNQYLVDAEDDMSAVGAATTCAMDGFEAEFGSLEEDDENWTTHAAAELLAEDNGRYWGVITAPTDTGYTFEPEKEPSQLPKAASIIEDIFAEVEAEEDEEAEDK